MKNIKKRDFERLEQDMDKFAEKYLIPAVKASVQASADPIAYKPIAITLESTRQRLDEEFSKGTGTPVA